MKKRAHDVTKKANLIAQQIMYQLKSERQVQYQPKSSPDKGIFRHQREYPVQVGLVILYR